MRKFIAGGCGAEVLQKVAKIAKVAKGSGERDFLQKETKVTKGRRR
jgi:hypothetical protein